MVVGFGSSLDSEDFSLSFDSEDFSLSLDSTGTIVEGSAEEAFEELLVSPPVEQPARRMAAAKGMMNFACFMIG